MLPPPPRVRLWKDVYEYRHFHGSLLLCYRPVPTKSVSFYSWYKNNARVAGEGYSSPVSPVSPASSDKIDSYDDEPLALIVPSNRRLSDMETCFKDELEKMWYDRQKFNNNNNTNNNNSSSKNNNNIGLAPVAPHKVENGFCNSINISNNHHHHHHITITHNTNENNEDEQEVTVEEALRHGEVFLRWLKTCSDPNVSVLQAMQIGSLLEKLRASLMSRSQSRQ